MTNKLISEAALSNDRPKWIFYFGIFLAAFGIMTGLIGIFSPTKFFIDFPNFTQWADISYVTNSWGTRNLTMGAAMLIALWIRTPSAIGVVFSMRFLTELGDLLNTLVTKHGSMGIPLIILTVVWVIFFLLPEALATRWGITRAIELKH